MEGLTGEVVVHPRVCERHPELTEEDVRDAWTNYVRMSRREGDDDYFVAVGFDMRGRVIEMVAVEMQGGGWYVYHAFTPATKGVLRELGLSR